MTHLKVVCSPGAGVALNIKSIPGYIIGLNNNCAREGIRQRSSIPSTSYTSEIADMFKQVQNRGGGRSVVYLVNEVGALGPIDESGCASSSKRHYNR